MKYLPYIKAISKVRKKLNSIKNLSAFCREHNLDYAICLNIKNSQTKRPHPDVVKSLLKLNGYKVSKVAKEIIFILE